MHLYRAGILTVSDTASADASLDRSGAVLSEQLVTAGFRDVQRRICPDNVDAIRGQVQSLVDEEHVQLVITTGGTGFGLRDVTPEAVEPLITRKTPALTHALTAHSLTKTPLAALSRGITGIRKCASDKEALIVCLPGSPKAVKECLQVLLGNGLLKHALELLAGGSGEPRHKQMQGGLHRTSAATANAAAAAVDTSTETGCAHHHHHHHHHHGGSGLHSHSAPKPRTTPLDHSAFRTVDPSSGASLRHRTSPYPLLHLDEALSLIAQHTPSPTTIETLALSTQLIGHVLAEDVKATCDLPPGATTNVDGYAVKASATPPGVYEVITLQALQSGSALEAGKILRINTGQGLPAATDSVVMVEDTELNSSHVETGEELTVRILAQVEQGENVRARGSDVEAGQVVLRKGTTISALGGEIGTLAFLGRSEVKVYRKPTIAILSTGNELIDPARAPAAASTTTEWGFNVFDANRPGLHAAIRALGFEIVDLGISSDSVDSTLAALTRGLGEADVILTTGGTSMGEADLLKPLIERQLKGTIHFGRVAIKPGKPTTFATVEDKIIFALPGNPASALVTFYVFVLPCLRKWCGFAPNDDAVNAWNLPKVAVTLAAEMRLDARPEFHRVVVKAEHAALVAYSTGSQRSS